MDDPRRDADSALWLLLSAYGLIGLAIARTFQSGARSMVPAALGLSGPGAWWTRDTYVNAAMVITLGGLFAGTAMLLAYRHLVGAERLPTRAPLFLAMLAPGALVLAVFTGLAINWA